MLFLSFHHINYSCGDHIVTVDECCNQVGGRGASNSHHQKYIGLLTPPDYPSNTFYIKTIPDRYNIRYKQNPYCDFPCNTMSLVWWFQTNKSL